MSVSSLTLGGLKISLEVSSITRDTNLAKNTSKTVPV